ncbi:MAG: hypothetical protein JWQ34_3550 [Mucilaginibacter sp.]|uniref:hypothetical protein n=1 Tax=Mucilaginibacter sp. TaxID=1882438 RepID=UPI00260888ED|nr:hypothetical protein [Mucilaginibacter sp.]MDB5005325.1 hypothetical protein [Mucilaginibacter sp.]
MKKKNLFSKLWLKHTDKRAYKEYKWLLANYKNIEFKRFMTDTQRLSNFNKIKAYADAHKKVNFNHSGNSGDIIYALPTIREIHELTGVATNLYFRLNQPSKLAEGLTHPLGNVMLNQKMVDMLVPLIKAQPYINECEANTDQPIDIDLDYFRSGAVPQDKGNIARWCGYITGVSPVLWKKWLTVEPNKDYNNTIVVARSERYRNPLVNYKFLSGYDNVVFVGVKSEYDDILKAIPNIKWVQVDDFLQLAQIIAGSKLFIGNQSFPFSIAEGLKVPRVLEVCFDVINVVPEGEGGHDFFFQDHFEALVARLAGR